MPQSLETYSQRINSIEISSTSAMVNLAAQLKGQGADILDFGPGEPHFSTPAHIKEAAINALRRDFTKYTAVAGTRALREAIAARQADDFGADYGPDEVIATPGGKYALFAAVQTLINDGDEVVIPAPYWVSFTDMVRFAGGKCVFVDTSENGFSLTASMIEKALTPKTRLIILNYPNNPSGALLDLAELEEIVDLAARKNIWVISDECYLYLTFDGRPVSCGHLKPKRHNVIIAGSVSKTYAMTGWRLGYAMAPTGVIAAIQKLQSQEISCASSISQMAAIAALTGPQDCVETMRLEYKRLRDLAVNALSRVPGLRLVAPRGAFYLFPDISEPMRKKGMHSASEFTSALLRETGVATIAGDGFGLDHYMRISFAVSQQQLSSGMERICEFIVMDERSR